MTSPAIMRLMGLLAIVGMVAGCGDRRLPEEVSACMDKAVESASRVNRLQCEMIERIHVGGLSADEALYYEARIEVAGSEFSAALEELWDAAEKHGLNGFNVLDEVDIRTAPHTRRLRKQYPRAAQVILPPKADRKYS